MEQEEEEGHPNLLYATIVCSQLIQTPLKLSQALAKAGIPILGTSAEAIDIAEDRERFQHLLRGLGLKQPKNGTARTLEEAERMLIELTLNVTKGHKGKTCQILGISRPTLERKLQKYGVRQDQPT